LNTNRSNSYRISKIQTKDQVLVEEINQIRLNNPYYGLKRLKVAFLKQNQIISLNRLRRVCQLHNLQPKSYSKNWVKPKDKGLIDSKIPNLIKELKINKPNQVWCADFTYLKFQGYQYYLATVIDAYTKEITGFHLSTSHNTDLIVNALNRAYKQYGKPQITHNDQGSEYRSSQYLELLESLGITASNSAKSSPWENAFQESFYGKFKPELELKQLAYGSTFMDLYNYIANQIDYYNNFRIHTAIMETPTEFRQKFVPNFHPPEAGKMGAKTSLSEENFVYPKLVA
jgi:putative transposase